MTWKELSGRWQSESPKIFKKFQNIGVGLTSAGLAGVAIPSIPNVTFPPIISTISGYFIVAGFCIAGISKLTCADPSSLPPQNNKNG